MSVRQLQQVRFNSAYFTKLPHFFKKYEIIYKISFSSWSISPKRQICPLFILVKKFFWLSPLYYQQPPHEPQPGLVAAETFSPPEAGWPVRASCACGVSKQSLEFLQQTAPPSLEADSSAKIAFSGGPSYAQGPVTLYANLMSECSTPTGSLPIEGYRKSGGVADSTIFVISLKRFACISLGFW